MGQAFLYGNGVSTSGGTLVVTAQAGVTITVTRDEKTKIQTTDASGCAVFRGLDSGIWTVTAPDGTQQTVEVVLDYAVDMPLFEASITVTYPEGAICTCSDGTTTLTAPDTSGSYTFIVPNAGTWDIQATCAKETFTSRVGITENGQSEAVTVAIVLFSAAEPYVGTFYGKNWTCEGSSYTTYMPTLTVTEENIKMVVGGPSTSSGCSSLYNDTEIDFSTKETVELSYVNTASAKLCITNACKTGYPVLAEVAIPSGTGTVTLDVSALDQAGYVILHAVSVVKNGTNSASKTIKITDLRVR